MNIKPLSDNDRGLRLYYFSKLLGSIIDQLIIQVQMWVLVLEFQFDPCHSSSEIKKFIL